MSGAWNDYQNGFRDGLEAAEKVALDLETRWRASAKKLREELAEICRPHNEKLIAEGKANKAEAEVTRLRAALREIAEMHKGDQPAAYGLTDLEWADRHIRHMRVAACEALKPKS